MTQHIKTKHYDKIGEYKRGRGRPKKAEGIDASLAQAREIFFRNFFYKPSRGCYDMVNSNETESNMDSIENSKDNKSIIISEIKSNNVIKSNVNEVVESSNNKELNNNTNKEIGLNKQSNKEEALKNNNKSESVKDKLLNSVDNSESNENESNENNTEEDALKNKTYNPSKQVKDSITENLEKAITELIQQYSHLVSLTDTPKEPNKSNTGDASNSNITLSKEELEKIKEKNNIFSIKKENIRSDPKLITIDESFVLYLDYTKTLANADYFVLICKFVLLFREFINLYKKGINSSLGNGNEVSNLSTRTVPFTVTNTSDCIPDCCNDFMVDYIEANNFFGLDFYELIDLIQHYCCWLYENGMTMLIISLISN